MKQSEKLDLILRFLYDRKFDGYHYNLSGILEENGINSNLDEAFALGKRLERDGLIEGFGTEEGGMSVCLTTDGIDYIENDSYSNKGHSIITNHYNYSISDSNNTNIVHDSSNISISQNSNQVNDINPLAELIFRRQATKDEVQLS